MFGSIATTTTLRSSREAKALQLLVGGATRRRRGSELRVRRFGKNRHTSSDRPNPINNHITEVLFGIMFRWFFQVLITYDINCKLPEGPYGWPDFLKISKNNKKRLVFFWSQFTFIFYQILRRYAGFKRRRQCGGGGRHHMERANNNILLVPMGLLLEGLSFFKKKEKKIASKVCTDKSWWLSSLKVLIEMVYFSFLKKVYAVNSGHAIWTKKV